MPQLSFKAQFADAVTRGLRGEPGGKCQTIRAARKTPFKVGDTLHLFTGMRTKECQRLGQSVCMAVYDIAIRSGGEEDGWQPVVTLNGKDLLSADVQSIAERDGFKNAAQLLAWFQTVHGLPFHGQLIRW